MLPLDSDGLMGEGPGLCIEVSGMSWVDCYSLWIASLINGMVSLITDLNVLLDTYPAGVA